MRLPDSRIDLESLTQHNRFIVIVALTDSHQLRTTPARIALVSIVSAVLAIFVSYIGGVADTQRPLSFGHDLLPSYVAGRIVSSGHAQRIYDPALCTDVGRAVMTEANLAGNANDVRWLNPGFFALLFVPLAQSPYRTALMIWIALNAALFGGAMQALAAPIPAKRRLVFVAAVLASCPLLLAVEHQQNSFLSLAILSATVAAWRGRRPLLAGCFAGLMAYKPQLAAAVTLALVLSQGWRALVGVATSATALLLAGEIAAPGSTLAFLHDVPPVVRAIQAGPDFNWGRQVTPTSFFCGLLGAQQDSLARGLGIGVSALATVVLAWFAWRSRHQDRAAIDRFIVVTFLMLPLTAIYFMDYDLLPLTIPLTLAMRGKVSVPVIALAATLWLAFYLNNSAVQSFHVGVAVVALAISAASALTGGTSPSIAPTAT